MTGPPANKTQWFYLSQRELMVLAVGVGAVLAVAAAAGGFERLWGRSDVAVVGRGDPLPPPARIDINGAPDYELSMLPGIGPKTAQAIIDDRRERGPFTGVDDLMRVKGLGPATVEAIRPYATCGPARKGADHAQD